MKKRTLLTASLLVASMSQASVEDSKKYLEENTGVTQPALNELCLKVTTLSIVSMMPGGAASMPIGLEVASGTSSYDLVVAPDYATKTCDTGYIKILTTAPLMSKRNAPIGL